MYTIRAIKTIITLIYSIINVHYFKLQLIPYMMMKHDEMIFHPSANLELFLTRP